MLNKFSVYQSFRVFCKASFPYCTAQKTSPTKFATTFNEISFVSTDEFEYFLSEALNKAAHPWGIQCMRYEIRDMKMPPKIAEAMQMQVEAERKKRAAILESEGIREAEINVAEGRKRATILSSEAEQQQKVNQAKGDADAMVAKATARAKAIAMVAEQLSARNGQNAASFAVAEQYVTSFGQLAKQSNTLIVPANTADASSIVAQAMTVYKHLTSAQHTPSLDSSTSTVTHQDSDRPQSSSTDLGT